ncbi:MAG: RsmF rRNA methyltransferase first C-terminal domain-containing protein, partial [Lachnospiraceae bacterium]|nr:RsmF rRNA methyltransferase first C-terminal domain-containing protein [Lachnospiraceae bacterium]
VLRPGLHLGTLKKNRFEPSHALALALKKEEVTLCAQLSVEEAGAYLRGQTFAMGDITVLPENNQGGWCLVCVEGFSTGWGKLAGNMLKNHYPKGLRKG